MNNFVRTIAINKILAMTKRKKIVQGGTSAGKTFGILPILINKALINPNITITVVAGTLAHLKKGALRDFLKIMKATQRFQPKCWNKSELIYSFNNGSVIEFMNADQDKATGSRRNVLYINEANKGVDFAVYTELESRTSGDIYIDFNPANQFWPHTEVLQEDDAELIILTYEDNKDCITGKFALPQTIIENLLNKLKRATTSEFWKNWCNVYIYGQIGKLEGAVFQNWDVIQDIPKDAKLIGYGMDLGFSPDPTAIVAIYTWRNADKELKIIIDEITYATKLKTEQISTILQTLNRGVTVWSDNDKRLIEELMAKGHNIRRADKTGGSIKEGIFLMQDYDMLITSRSENILYEIDKYIWSDKKAGVPIDAFNHTLDAIRYVFWMCLGKNAGPKYALTPDMRQSFGEL